MVRLFLGETTPADVLAAANDPDPATRKDQLCEANFYSGELALLQGAKEEATRLFRLAAADCPRGFDAHGEPSIFLPAGPSFFSR